MTDKALPKSIDSIEVDERQRFGGGGEAYLRALADKLMHAQRVPIEPLGSRTNYSS